MPFPTTEKWRAALRVLFSSEASAPAPAATVTAKPDRDLARLKEWLGEVLQKMTSELETGDAVREKRGFVDSINIDAAKFSRDDLLAIAPEYEALHDLCLKHNVSLEFAGFDVLPRRGMTSTNMSWSLVPEAIVHVDCSKPYNGYSHPRYVELRDAGVELDGPQKRIVSPS